MFHWLNYVSAVSILIPTGVCLYKYKQLEVELKFLSWLLIFGSAIESANYVFMLSKVSNFWIVNIYSAIEGLVLCYITGKWIDTKRMLALALLLFMLYLLYWFYTTFYTHTFFDFNNREKTVKGLILIFLSGYALIRLSMNEYVILAKDFRFWILSAILIYFSVTLIIFGTATILIDGHHRAMFYSWPIHSVVNIISNLLFAFGFIWYYRRMNSYI